MPEWILIGRLSFYSLLFVEEGSLMKAEVIVDVCLFFLFYFLAFFTGNSFDTITK